jgi:hypothetical protein
VSTDGNVRDGPAQTEDHSTPPTMIIGGSPADARDGTLVGVVSRSTERWYLVSRTLGLGGDSVVGALLPLLTVLLFGGGPAEVALVLLARQVVNFVASFPLAVWLDRRGERVEVQIIALLVTAASVAAVPLLWAAGTLPFPLLLAVSVVFFACDTVITTSGYSLINQITSPGTRVTFTGQLASSRAVADISGQSAGPALLGVVAGPVAVLAGAALAVVSALTLLPVRRHLHAGAGNRRDGPAAATPAVSRGTLASVAAQVRTALFSLRSLSAVVVRQPVVVVVWAAAAGGSITAPILIVYAVADLGLSAEAYGLLTAVGAIGGIVGGLAVGRLSAWLKPLPLMGVACLLAAAAVPVLALGELVPHTRALSYAGVAGYEGLTAFAGTIAISLAFGRLQETAAESEIAQTMSVVRLGLDATIIAALSAGGWVGSTAGSHAVFIVAATILVLTAAGSFLMSARSSATGPEHDTH